MTNQTGSADNRDTQLWTKCNALDQALQNLTGSIDGKSVKKLSIEQLKKQEEACAEIFQQANALQKELHEAIRNDSELLRDTSNLKKFANVMQEVSILSSKGFEKKIIWWDPFRLIRRIRDLVTGKPRIYVSTTLSSSSVNAVVSKLLEKIKPEKFEEKVSSTLFSKRKVYQLRPEAPASWSAVIKDGKISLQSSSAQFTTWEALEEFQRTLDTYSFTMNEKQAKSLIRDLNLEKPLLIHQPDGKVLCIKRESTKPEQFSIIAVTGSPDAGKLIEAKSGKAIDLQALCTKEHITEKAYVQLKQSLAFSQKPSYDLENVKAEIQKILQKDSRLTEQQEKDLKAFSDVSQEQIDNAIASQTYYYLGSNPEQSTESNIIVHTNSLGEIRQDIYKLSFDPTSRSWNGVLTSDPTSMAKTFFIYDSKSKEYVRNPQSSLPIPAQQVEKDLPTLMAVQSFIDQEVKSSPYFDSSSFFQKAISHKLTTLAERYKKLNNTPTTIRAIIQENGGITVATLNTDTTEVQFEEFTPERILTILQERMRVTGNVLSPIKDDVLEKALASQGNIKSIRKLIQDYVNALNEQIDRTTNEIKTTSGLFDEETSPGHLDALIKSLGKEAHGAAILTEYQPSFAKKLFTTTLGVAGAVLGVADAITDYIPGVKSVKDKAKKIYNYFSGEASKSEPPHESQLQGLTPKAFTLYYVDGEGKRREEHLVVNFDGIRLQDKIYKDMKSIKTKLGIKDLKAIQKNSETKENTIRDTLTKLKGYRPSKKINLRQLIDKCGSHANGTFIIEEKRRDNDPNFSTYTCSVIKNQKVETYELDMREALGKVIIRSNPPKEIDLNKDTSQLDALFGNALGVQLQRLSQAEKTAEDYDTIVEQIRQANTGAGKDPKGALRGAIDLFGSQIQGAYVFSYTEDNTVLRSPTLHIYDGTQVTSYPVDLRTTPGKITIAGITYSSLADLKERFPLTHSPSEIQKAQDKFQKKIKDFEKETHIQDPQKDFRMELMNTLSTQTDGKVWCLSQMKGQHTPPQYTLHTYTKDKRGDNYISYSLHLKPDFKAGDFTVAVEKSGKTFPKLENVIHELTQIPLDEVAQHRWDLITFPEEQKKESSSIQPKVRPQQTRTDDTYNHPSFNRREGSSVTIEPQPREKETVDIQPTQPEKLQSTKPVSKSVLGGVDFDNLHKVLTENDIWKKSSTIQGLHKFNSNSDQALEKESVNTDSIQQLTAACYSSTKTLKSHIAGLPPEVQLTVALSCLIPKGQNGSFKKLVDTAKKIIDGLAKDEKAPSSIASALDLESFRTFYNTVKKSLEGDTSIHTSTKNALLKKLNAFDKKG